MYGNGEHVGKMSALYGYGGYTVMNLFQHSTPPNSGDVGAHW
jgi:hypothetical protein